MKINPRCLLLAFKSPLPVRLSTDDEDLINRTIQECLKVLTKHYDPEAVSASIATKVHRKCYEVLEDRDHMR